MGPASPGDTILVMLPPYTDLTKLTPVIKIKGKSVSPASNVTLDLSSPVVFTVTADDGSQVKYIVIVKTRGAVFFGTNDSGPSVMSGTVYFGSGDRYLYALDASVGTVKWKLNLNGPVTMAAPLVTNGVVYIGSRSDSLYALDAVTGSQKWSAVTDGFSLEMSSPTIDNGVVYVGAESGSLFALDSATGTRKWKTLDFLSVYDANGSGPIVANGTLYVGGGGSHYFYAFDPANGSVKWKFYTGNSLVFSFRPLYIGAN